MNRPNAKPSFAELVCTECGACADAACDCGAPYLPAGLRAERAIANNPEKSDRAIAAEIGVSGETVRRARRTATDVAVEKRIGRDGKARRVPRLKIVAKEEMPSEEEAEQSHQQTLYDQACLLLERMAGKTRQRFFAHLERKYHVQVTEK